MAKEEKPLEYQRRIRDTKGVAQRLDLDYLKRTSWIPLLRKRITWAALAAAALASMPLLLGLGGSRRSVAAGPLSIAHTVYENRCENCHVKAFGSVPDQACLDCHDGAPHPAKSIDTAKPHSSARCAECHLEHRGRTQLRAVSDGNCTSCHANLSKHAAGVKIKALEITAFREGKHPEFAATTLADLRPLRLNHAIHMPARAKTIRNIKLPMKCTDCHVTDRGSTTGALLPVTFEQNCKSCHARELEFDVDHLLGSQVPPAPHARDAKVIREYVVNAYRGVDPRVREGATARALDYLFGRKCGYCHQMDSSGLPQQVGSITRHWIERGEFSHRAHRAVECDSCHASARASTKTEDVLVPSMKACLPCHGESRAGLDQCSVCHLYHNRALEKDRERRPVKELISQLTGRPW